MSGGMKLYLDSQHFVLLMRRLEVIGCSESRSWNAIRCQDFFESSCIATALRSGSNVSFNHPVFTPPIKSSSWAQRISEYTTVHGSFQ